MSKVIKLEDHKPTEYVFTCNCLYDENDNKLNDFFELFFIVEGGYECYHCKKFHSFENVHGSV